MMMTMMALAIAWIFILAHIDIDDLDIGRYRLIIGRASFAWWRNLCHVFHNIEKGKQKQLKHGKPRTKQQQQQDLTSAPW